MTFGHLNAQTQETLLPRISFAGPALTRLVFRASAP
jgi:hypothetical protein